LTPGNSLRKGYSTTLRITGIGELDGEAVLRGIWSTRTSISLLVTGDSLHEVYLSVCTMGQQKTATGSRLTDMPTLLSLLPGFHTEEDSIPPIQFKKYATVLHVLGLPHYGGKGQTEAFVQGMSSIGAHPIMIVNIRPCINASVNTKGRESHLARDASFGVSISFLLTENDPGTLESHINSLIALIGSLYDSQYSDLSVLPETGKKARKALEKIIHGKIRYGSVLTTREAATFLQIPEVHGIERIQEPRLHVPTFTEEQKLDIDLGMVVGHFGEDVHKALFDPASVFQHGVVWGMSGYGKSTLLKHLIGGFHNKGYPSIIFDLHDEYRGMVPSLNGEMGRDILVYNPFVRMFSLNPLEIPNGIKGAQRENAISDTIEGFLSLLKHMWSFGEVQEQRCRKHLFEMYEDTDTPLISQLITRLRGDMRTRIKRDEDSLPGKMEKFISPMYRELFNQPSSTLPFDKIERCTTIFELGQMPIEIRTFFVTVFLNQWWNHQRVSKGANPNVLVLDEFHHYDGISVVKKLLSEGRKYRQGVICSHQGPHQITDRELLGEIIRNTSTKVAFRSTFMDDVRLITSALGIQDREIETFLTKMDVGDCLVSMRHHRQPFRMRSHDFISSGVQISDEEILDGVPLDSIDVEEIEEEGLKAEEIQFLSILGGNPSMSTHDVIKEMRIMKSRGWAIKNTLVDDGYLIEENVKKGGQGRPSKVIKLSECGLDIIGAEREGTPAHHGGTEHITMVKDLAGILDEEGWNVKVEEGADIRAERDGRIIAVEVETCKSFNRDQILRNISRNLRWADQVLIACPNLRDRMRIKKLIEPHGYEKVSIHTYESTRDLFLNESEQI